MNGVGVSIRISSIRVSNSRRSSTGSSCCCNIRSSNIRIRYVIAVSSIRSAAVSFEGIQ